MRQDRPAAGGEKPMAIDRRDLGKASSSDPRRPTTIPLTRRRVIRDAAALGAGTAALGIPRTAEVGAEDNDTDLKQSQLRQPSSNARTLRIAAFDSPAHLDPH